MHYQILNGTKWYYRLKDEENDNNQQHNHNQNTNHKNKKGLFNDYPRNTLYGKFLTCLTFADKKLEKKDTMLLYAVFQSYLDFVIYFLSFPPELRCFYEIILGEYPSKPHFDLDMSVHEPYQEVFNNLIHSIISTLKEKGIILNLEKDICIYTSNKDEKVSYHIVINNYCHSNNKEAKSFYFNVMNKLPPEYFAKGWIDKSVYSPTQQFRTLGSHKIYSNRFKRLVEKWNLTYSYVNEEGENVSEVREIVHYFDERELADCSTEEEREKRKFLLQFEESLITARVSSCTMIPSYEVPEVFEKTKRNYVPGADVDYDEAMAALTLLAHMAGTVPEDRSFPYRLDRLAGPFVVLKRMKPSHCRLCNRIHHHQNPYLLIVPENKNVFFHCRRAPATKNLYVGSLLSEEEKDAFISTSSTSNSSASSPKNNSSPFNHSNNSGKNPEQDKKIEEVALTWSEEKWKQLQHAASSKVESKNKNLDKEREKEIQKKIRDDIYFPTLGGKELVSFASSFSASNVSNVSNVSKRRY